MDYLNKIKILLGGREEERAERVIGYSTFAMGTGLKSDFSAISTLISRFLFSIFLSAFIHFEREKA